MIYNDLNKTFQKKLYQILQLINENIYLFSISSTEDYIVLTSEKDKFSIPKRYSKKTHVDDISSMQLILEEFCRNKKRLIGNEINLSSVI